MEVRREVKYDVMRLLAMMGVIIFHIGEIIWGEQLFFPRSLSQLVMNWEKVNWSPWYVLALMGDMAVPVFLFLSGYLLVLKNQEFSGKWLGGRLKKLLVPFWWAVIGGSLITAWIWHSDPEIIRRGVAGDFGWDKIIWAALLMQNWSAYTFNAPVPAWWFMGILVQLYVLYGILKYLLDRCSKKNYLKLVIGGQLVWNLVALVLAGNERWLYVVYYNGLSYGAVFGLGMWMARYKVKIKASWGVVMVLGGWLIRLVGGRWIMLSEAILAWGWFGMLDKVISRAEVFNDKIVNWLGEIGRKWSYNIYLWHQPVLWLIVWLIRNRGWGLAW